MHHRSQVFRRVCACLLGTFALTSQLTSAESIDLSCGGAAVRATAVAPGIFRISVQTGAKKAQPIESVYLDPNFKPGDVGQVNAAADGHQQLRTVAGTLDIDPAAGTLSLRDASGAVLIPTARVVDETSESAKPVLNLHLGWPGDREFAVYACGNGADHLLQHQVQSHVDNGVAVEPFFWAPAGFATFVVGGDGDAPATCDGNVQQNAVTWRVPGTAADLYLMIAPTLGDASRSLLGLTGRPPVPPRWAMGYLQSRWGWKDRAYIEDVQNQFTTRKLPVDAFIFDFEWYTKFPDYEVKPQGLPDYVDFGWNDTLFPDPVNQLKQLHDAGIHFVGIRKPRLGNSKLLEFIRSQGWDFRGPRLYDARDLRFDLPGLRTWYAQHTIPLLRDGIDGWWDDEGEYTYTTYTNWNASEQEALSAVNPTARLWTLDRAFQPGSARWGAAAWTGDIRASWEDFQKTPATLLNWSVAGMPYCGCDIGGFVGETTAPLLVRWMEAGTFFPVMRTHSERTVTPHFPWLFGDDAEAAMRKALDLRYQLVPVLYSLAHQTHATGEPLMRPLLMQYPHDPKVADLTDEWLLGQDLLAAPMLTPGDRRTVYLPDDIWYDFATGQRVAGNQALDRTVRFDEAPLYVRGGAILTLAPVVQHTRDLPGGPLEVHVFPGRDGRFTLVEDDGKTTAYLNGKVRETTFAWNEASHTLSWTQHGGYDGNDCFRSMHIVLHGEHGGEKDLALSAGGQAKFE